MTRDIRDCPVPAPAPAPAPAPVFLLQADKAKEVATLLTTNEVKMSTPDRHRQPDTTVTHSLTKP